MKYRTLFSIFQIFILLTTACWAPAFSAELVERGTITSADTIIINGTPYLSLKKFVNRLDASAFFSTKTQKTMVYHRGYEIKVAIGSPFVIVNSKIFQMPLACVYAENDILVPADFFPEIVSRELQLDTPPSTQPEVLEPLDPLFNIIGLEIQPKLNGMLLHLKTTQQFKRDDVTFRWRKPWLYLDVYHGKVDTNAIYATPQISGIAEIIPHQVSANMAQISLRLTIPVIETKILIPEIGNSIAFVLRSQEDIPLDVLTNLESDRQKWQIDRIVIDPGHGGKDPGAVGPNGVLEKDVVLRISRYLKTMLEKDLGVDVIMTRDSDTFIPLHQRTEIANQNAAKLFISIHANANKNRTVQGTSTYILGTAKTDEAVEAARLENSVIKLEESPQKYPHLEDEQFILSSMAQSEFTRESEQLAAAVQNNTSRLSGLRDRGVKQGDYYVLIGASMPNILFETAFISNPAEERKLKTSAFQKKIAKGIFEGIKDFKSLYDAH